jgi:thiamine pyrophosphate-dependent acetolactate synthase large subunit-like protein
VLTAGARDAALALGRRIGAAFATTVGGKSALPDEPFDLGLTGMMASPLARDVARAADVVLVLGAGLDQYNTDGATLGTGATIVRVDVRDPAQLWHPPGAAQVSLTGDLPQVLASLTTALTTALPTGPDRVGVRDADLRRRLDDETARRADLTTTPMPDGPNPWAAMAVLSETLPPDAHVVVGIGHFWYFVTPYLSPAPDRRFQFGSGFGLIGQALPLGIGAAVAMAAGQRRPVVVIDGDGSIAMNIQELHSAVRLGIDLLVVVLDNRSYGSEFHKLAVAGLDPAVSNVEDPIDFAALAGALGAVGRTAADLPALRRELGDLVPRHGTRLLHAAIARTPMSEVYQRQHAHPEPSR